MNEPDWADEKARAVVARMPFLGTEPRLESAWKIVAQALRDERGACEAVLAALAADAEESLSRYPSDDNLEGYASGLRDALIAIALAPTRSKSDRNQ